MFDCLSSAGVEPTFATHALGVACLPHAAGFDVNCRGLCNNGAFPKLWIVDYLLKATARKSQRFSEVSKLTGSL